MSLQKILSKMNLKNRILIPANLVSTILLLALVAGVYIYQKTSSSASEQLITKVGFISNFLSESSKIYIQNWDLNALESFVKMSVADSDINYAVFYDNNGKIMTESSKIIESPDIFKKVIEIKSDEDVVVGKLVIGYNFAGVTKTIRSVLLFLLLGAVITQLIISITLSTVANNISQPLEEVMDFLKKSVIKINDISKNLISSSAVLLKGVNSQSTSMQETVASISEIRSMSKQTNDKVESSLELGRDTSNNANEGAAIMSSLTESMNAIHDANSQLTEMVNIIHEISNKTNIINEIVFQTRLLSFNASIEAARAGQHGKGFAVVAEEVGDLAEMSGQAAKEISELLEKSTKKVQEIVTLTNSKVVRGQQISKDALISFEKISDHVNEIVKSFETIKNATGEQLTGLGECSIALNEMKEVSFANHKVSDSTDVLAQNLNSESCEIKKFAEVIEMIVLGLKDVESKKNKTGTYVESLLNLKSEELNRNKKFKSNYDSSNSVVSVVAANDNKINGHVESADIEDVGFYSKKISEKIKENPFKGNSRKSADADVKHLSQYFEEHESERDGTEQKDKKAA
ncbi:MAG: hypothetical protein HQK50_11955 [Oligoflexia bacterium]|nr:hypothetical protein [Oligoflexia bacterium]MBF0366278.1 hypothetical protein [Oligoflexia bacterium]